MKYFPLSFVSFFLVLFFSFGFISAQTEKEIIDTYEDYVYLPREVVYLHLNKTTVFAGETLGFTAYVLNKDDKTPSLTTKNLYVIIEDNNKNIIKQKMLMVDNGVASNVFEIDSLFSKNTYTIKAYTNFMRNFNENNFFIENFEVETIENYQSIINESNINHIDAQFLPESGHLLHGVENVIGVIIKDHNGNGVNSVFGEVVDKNGTVVATFKTNQFGISRFLLMPRFGNSYFINFNHKDKAYKFQLNEVIKKRGIILSLKRLKEKILVSAITNDDTFESVKNKRYKLLLHNGSDYHLMDIYFTDKPIVTKVLDLGNNPGINILTLFDQNDIPIAERLTFNYKGINIISTKGSSPSIEQERDSVKIALNFKLVDTLNTHNISISVLPQETQSYKRSHNLISYNFLHPYLQNPIENAKYYFTDITEKKKYELDNLLLTQGWSSYDWNYIFNNEIDIMHDYEQGFILKANYVSKHTNDSGKPNDLIYHFNNKGFLIAEPDINSQSYIIKNLYPEEGQNILLSEITNSKGLKPANLYVQFYPREIPNFKIGYTREIKPAIEIETEPVYSGNVVFNNLKKVEKLDEVVVKSSPYIEQSRRRAELSTARSGRICIVSEDDKKQYFSLWNYLFFKAQLRLDPTKYGPNGPRNYAVLNSLSQQSPGSLNFYLDDVLLADLSILDPILIEDVDFIEINQHGIGDGIRSPNGFIKIYTKEPTRAKASINVTRTYEFPLTFNKRKKFYTPRYRYYDDDFFKLFGVIDWKPSLKVDKNGKVFFKIEKPQVPITLFIEGITNDGSFIFEEKSISLN